MGLAVAVFFECFSPLIQGASYEVVVHWKIELPQGLAAYGGYQLGTALYEIVVGEEVGTGRPLDAEERIDKAAAALGGLAGGALSCKGMASGPEFKVPFGIGAGPTGKPMRIAPFGNRTGHPLGERPHYHRAIPDPANPGQSLPHEGLGNHRPWEGGGS